MSKKIETLVEQATKNLVESMGFELADVEYLLEDQNWVLTLYIDHPNGVSMDDCEKVSRAVDPIIDELDPTMDSFYLSVSSLGIDRPLKKMRDFERALGKEIEIHLYAPLDKKKLFIGVLTSFNETQIEIENKGVKQCFMHNQVALARPTVHFHELED